MRLAMGQQKSVQVAIVNYRKDGSPFWNLLTVSPLKDAQGNVTNYIGIQIRPNPSFVDRLMPRFPWSR